LVEARLYALGETVELGQVLDAHGMPMSAGDGA
jgi:hypothetical protein